MNEIYRGLSLLKKIKKICLQSIIGWDWVFISVKSVAMLYLRAFLSRFWVSHGSCILGVKPITLTSDVLNKENKEVNIIDPNSNNSYKTKKTFTGFHTEVNSVFLITSRAQLEKKNYKRHYSTYKQEEFSLDTRLENASQGRQVFQYRQ